MWFGCNLLDMGNGDNTKMRKNIISNVYSSDEALKERLENLMKLGWDIKKHFCILCWQIIILERRSNKK